MTKENIVIKKDTSVNWEKAKNFIPKQGEIIVYEDLKSSIKIGDGITKLKDLPFLHNFKYKVINNLLQITEGE